LLANLFGMCASLLLNTNTFSLGSSRCLRDGFLRLNACLAQYLYGVGGSFGQGAPGPR